MNHREYWKECLSIAADDTGFTIPPDQLEILAEAAEGGHEHYGMAFYSPPASDRLSQIEREWKDKYEELEKRFARYQEGAEKAVGKALHQYHDSHIRICENGDVFRDDGRTTQIQ